MIVAISDGDTVKARCGEPGASQQVSVRLAEIDAPESAQAYGKRSKAALSVLCFGVWATIKPLARDGYGRTVARLECRGKDASSEQVRQGMAWAFTRYLTDPEIKRLEEGARASRAGLWDDPEPLAPSDWRASQRLKPSGLR
ncbi:thermonuclease family protein [Ramlibacter henchirensis]|uniref:thermonuclease family protein n=1 Tax=Ramlibacter henchirensis TaxID=204072 RepID=UPI001F0D9824|nr:thermonuclease family protein [Ramlibacter henchirensis]